MRSFRSGGVKIFTFRGSEKAERHRNEGEDSKKHRITRSMNHHLKARCMHVLERDGGIKNQGKKARGPRGAYRHLLKQGRLFVIDPVSCCCRRQTMAEFSTLSRISKVHFHACPGPKGLKEVVFYEKSKDDVEYIRMR
ncbi:hypothetical protein AAMO2058_000505000 [Amorphochlora amoebiformis]